MTCACGHPRCDRHRPTGSGSDWHVVCLPCLKILTGGECATIGLMHFSITCDRCGRPLEKREVDGGTVYDCSPVQGSLLEPIVVVAKAVLAGRETGPR